MNETTILTSIHGHRIGLNVSNQIVGPKGLNLSHTSIATSGVITAHNFAQTHTAVGASAEALVCELTSNVALGTYANAIVGRVDLGTSGEVTGLIGAICAEINMPSTDAPAGGEYAAFEAEFNMAGSSVNGSPIIVTEINVWGTGAAQFDTNGLLFDITGVTSGSGKFYYDNTSNAADAFVKCRINGAVYYIPLSDSGTTFA